MSADLQDHFGSNQLTGWDYVVVLKMKCDDCMSSMSLYVLCDDCMSSMSLYVQYDDCMFSMSFMSLYVQCDDCMSSMSFMPLYVKFDDCMSSVMLFAAHHSAVIGQKKKLLGERRKNNPWVTTEIMDVSYKRRELRHEEYISLVSRTDYKKENRGVTQKMKEAKEE
ncbi:hypothetical protein DPMN_003329 [Dreissena polymorpha]|uniref:Uncharacterized protein n=1 Tax=Dreissena polymorpha TaxID=45954 RepID=A0A9D4MN85_DREPO|nr:hypothetical protein DPMN_003329 [Dreissena polymorpha]